MKTITIPARHEEATYHCDVTGLPLPNGPAATVTISCGYGAPYDGYTFELHLSSRAAEVVLPLLRAILLGGGPLEPHFTDSTFNDCCEPERPVTPRELLSLVRELRRIHQNRPSSVAGRARKAKKKMRPLLDHIEAEFGYGKTTVTEEELEASREMHAQRKHAVPQDRSAKAARSRGSSSFERATAKVTLIAQPWSCPSVSPGFEPCMLFSGCRSKSVVSN
jgi:hypothetical protein